MFLLLLKRDLNTKANECKLKKIKHKLENNSCHTFYEAASFFLLLPAAVNKKKLYNIGRGDKIEDLSARVTRKSRKCLRRPVKGTRIGRQMSVN